MSRRISVDDRRKAAPSRTPGRMAVGRWLRDEEGVAIIEFAFIFPIIVAFFLGIVQFAMLAMDYHLTGEAARKGGRAAVITELIPSLPDIDAGPVTCLGVTTALAPGYEVDCGGATMVAADSFGFILSEMQSILSGITAENVRVRYSVSGLENADQPGVITPQVIVTLVNFQAQLPIAAGFGLPSTFVIPPVVVTRLAPSRVIK